MNLQKISLYVSLHAKSAASITMSRQLLQKKQPCDLRIRHLLLCGNEALCTKTVKSVYFSQLVRSSSYHNNEEVKDAPSIAENLDTDHGGIESQPGMYKNIVGLSTQLINTVPGVVNVFEVEQSVDRKDVNKTDSTAKEDLSHIKPSLPAKVTSLAAYVNDSDVLQKLLKLQVDLSVLEKDPEVANFVLRANFEENVQPYIIFYLDLGVKKSSLGKCITKNPRVFMEPLDNLEVRVNYLRSKKFSADAIAEILTRAPLVISKTTQTLDAKLGYLQKTYKVTGDEIRSVVTRLPKLITWPTQSLKDNHFHMKEFMGFSQQELKEIFITCPKLFMTARRAMAERFNFLHDEMGMTIKDIMAFPMCLRYRLSSIIKPRHLFLVHLGKAQYDSTKENYVSLHSLLSGRDVIFCENVAKVPVKQYNEFLKTL